jgi:hypothetical protein
VFAQQRDNLRQGAAPHIDPDQCGLLRVNRYPVELASSRVPYASKAEASSPL